METLAGVRRYRWWLLTMLVLIALGAAAAVGPQRAAPRPEVERRTSLTGLTAPGPDTVLRLESLLGHHFVLACELMRGRIRIQEDFLAAANAALGKNTDAISQLVESLYGDQAAKQFSGVWTRHLGALLAYAGGWPTRMNGPARRPVPASKDSSAISRASSPTRHRVG